MFVIEFSEVKADRNRINFQFDSLHPISHQSFVPAVVFNDPEGAHGLDGTVHFQQCSDKNNRNVSKKHVPVVTFTLLIYHSEGRICNSFHFILIPDRK